LQGLRWVPSLCHYFLYKWDWLKQGWMRTTTETSRIVAWVAFWMQTEGLEDVHAVCFTGEK